MQRSDWSSQRGVIGLPATGMHVWGMMCALCPSSLYSLVSCIKTRSHHCTSSGLDAVGVKATILSAFRIQCLKCGGKFKTKGFKTSTFVSQYGECREKVEMAYCELRSTLCVFICLLRVPIEWVK
jgi:hypothetical protein